MGFAISWLAVSGKSPELVLRELRVEGTGVFEEIPESPMTCARLPSGWFLVFANQFNSPLVSERTLCALSIGGNVVTCQVEEHVMFSSAAVYVDGHRTWQVQHDAQKAIYDLQCEGTLPAQFHSIFATLKQQQDDDGGAESEVDYMHDVPVELARSIATFRHDQDISNPGQQPFEVLTRGAAAARPWWRPW